ncbi:MAG: AAA family ATPase [Cyanobacteria bacterium J06554_11]
MLTRLRVSGFKNLVDVDIRFGPFTCIAGTNGVGKSNLFDAIRFLSSLADRPLIEAALSVRDEEGKSGDVRSLFHRVGDTYADEMFFEAEMIIPFEAVDELGQTAEASITFVRYSLKLTYRSDDSLRSLGSLEILEEKLEHIKRGEANLHIRFPHKVKTWQKSALVGRRTSPFISTEGQGDNRYIKLHQDGGSSGRPLSRPASKLPRTVLSATNAAETPTALITRQEMRSWRLLQLEPTSLRKPDAFTAPTAIEPDGSHLAATLYHLANRTDKTTTKQSKDATEQIYADVASRLSDLISDVKSVWVDRDDQRQLLTLMVSNRDGTEHPARALSDGTMRFLALAVLELDLTAEGVICLEEPENGIHPERIPKILHLLQDIATDTDEEVGADNPLRQVIINTHSPSVVQQVPDDSLVIAELKDTVQEGKRFKRVSFGCLPNTWRQNKAQVSEQVNTIAMGKLLSYLNPISKETESTKEPEKRRVIDRKDLTPLIPGLAEQFS